MTNVWVATRANTRHRVRLTSSSLAHDSIQQSGFKVRPLSCEIRVISFKKFDKSNRVCVNRNCLSALWNANCRCACNRKCLLFHPSECCRRASELHWSCFNFCLPTTSLKRKGWLMISSTARRIGRKFFSRMRGGWLLKKLDDNGTGTTTTVTNGCNTILTVLLLEYIDECTNDTSTGSTDWVAQSNGTTIDVHLRWVETEQLKTMKVKQTRMEIS